MNRVESLIFNLSGTLIDSMAELASAVNYTMTHMSLPLFPGDKGDSYPKNHRFYLADNLISQNCAPV